MTRLTALAIAAILVMGCAGPMPAASPTATSTDGAPPAATLPRTTATPLSSAMNQAELKLKLLEKYPDFFYCDPDLYPVARGDETELALANWEKVQGSDEVFTAIIRARSLEGYTTFSSEQKLAIYQDYKRLNAVTLQPDADHFKYGIRLASGAGREGSAVQGTINSNGVVTESKREPAIVSCPICLPQGALIDTPSGPVRVEDVVTGMEVWTSDENGARVRAIVLSIARARVYAQHTLARVRLADGRMVTASPGHPTAGGVALGRLRVGDLLDGSTVTALQRVTYGGGFTYDLLPAGATGIYWADGVPLSSTLR